MTDYRQTFLWKRTLAEQAEGDEYQAHRDWLRNSYIRFRDNTEILAGEIKIVLPEYTVHDITHIDALWDMASLLVPEDMEINPAEAFVLGGAILLHDLGMALAAYPCGEDDVRKEIVWQDTVAALKKEYRAKHGTEKGLDERDVERKATEKTLRVLHAQRAEKLAFASWKDSHGKDVFLLEDVKLRDAYGRIIGLLAHSHWVAVDELEDRLSPVLGPLSEFPPEWKVDPVKLACILRLADAIQIDDRRAPGFLRPLRKLSAVSDAHWRFQEKLLSPRVENGRIIFTSKAPFTVDEIDAWWVGFDTLKMIDTEFRRVDTVMMAKYNRFFLATSVMAVEDAAKLSEWVKVDGWEPVDVKIQVNNVAKLVTSIGGSQLYGENPIVPLREMLQNASDAIRARRLMDGLESTYGQIVVTVGEDEHGHFIEVEDNGVGMSRKVLTGPLLDFGQSFWGSELMHDEFRGLETKGYTPTGKYGIGFFSLFMWGEKIHVTTNKYDKGRDSTVVLEMNHGAAGRPILRQAEPEEYITGGGTRVRVWVEEKTLQDILEARIASSYVSRYDKAKNFSQRIEELCPAMDCNINVKERGKIKTVIKANDWKTMPADKFLRRILPESYQTLKKNHEEVYVLLKNNLGLLKNNEGEIIGRASFYHRYGKMPLNASDRPHLSGVVTVGGLKTATVNGIIGVIQGVAHTAARNAAIPVASTDSIRAWMEDQIEKLDGYILSDEEQLEIAGMCRALATVKNKFKMCGHQTGFLTYDEVVRLVKKQTHSQYILVGDYTIHELRNKENTKLDFSDNVFWYQAGRPGIINPRVAPYIEWPENEKYPYRFDNRSVKGLVIEAIAEGWGVDVDKLYNSSNFSDDDVSFKAQIGTRNGKPVIDDFVTIIKP